MANQNLTLRRGFILSTIFFLLVLFSGPLAYGQWTSVTPPSVSGAWDLQRVHFTSPQEGWAVGWNYENHRGVLLHYSGGTWASVVPSSGVLDTRYLNGVHFTSPEEGWAVGWESWSNHQIILHYTGGEWTAVPSSNVHATALYAVQFTSPDVGWAVGVDWNQKGIVARYAGGAWTSFPLPNVSEDWYLRNVYFVSPDEGWAVGWDNEHQNGVILHYSGWTGGWGWTVAPLPAPSGYLNDVHFTSADEGWIVGSGSLFHYTGGAWVADPPYGGNGVVFLSASEGWSVGGNGCDGVVTYYSGGAWSYDTVPDLNTCWSLLDVSFPSEGQGWAVGADSTAMKGVILHYALLEVTSPDKNDKWQRGKTYQIRWTYSGDPGTSVAIDLYKGGLKKATIAEGVPIGSAGNGLYDWKIPSKQEQASDYQIKVTVEEDSLYTDMSPRFAIVKTPAKSNIILNSPAGGESWKTGTARTINWEFAANCGSKVKIDLLNNGNPDSVIADNVSIGIGGSKGGAGSFTWNIPSTQDAGSRYKMRVASKTRKDCQDTSDENFRITNPTLSPTITVVSPNGGEHWLANTHQGIEWGFTGDPGPTVKIELLKGGVVQSTVAADVAAGKDGKGRYTWLLPPSQESGGDYRVAITSQSNGAWSDTSNSDFVINPALKGATITLSMPNGGESWQAGTTHTIQWSYSGDPGSTVKIEAYRTTGTALAYYPIVASTSIGSGGTGSYSWAIPPGQPAGSDYKVVVTSTTNSSYADMSDNYFTITAGMPTPTVTMIFPNGGESWQAGTSHTIRSSYTGAPVAVKLELLKGGVLNSVIYDSHSGNFISTDVPLTLNYDWNIPASQPAGADYNIRVTMSTSNASYTDTSDANFTITAAPTIMLISPNGGETWQVGSTHNIMWTFAGFSSDSIKIELLKGAAVESTIASDVPMTNGTYPWTIPAGQATGSDYRVRLTWKSNDQVADTSDGYFTIDAPCFSPAGISLISPNGGETWLRGMTHAIQWSYMGCPGTTVKVELIRASAGALPITTTIINSTPIGTDGTGSYNWTIPVGQLIGTNVYKIKVTTDSGLSDTSDNSFSISGFTPPR